MGSDRPAARVASSQFSFVYCHGKGVFARYLGDGWYQCPCGCKFRAVVPDDDEIAEAA
jgi:hypothetical protein